MKEVEHPVVHVLESNTELVDTVSQEVRFWPTQFVAEFGETADLDPAFTLRLLREPV